MVNSNPRLAAPINLSVSARVTEMALAGTLLETVTVEDADMPVRVPDQQNRRPRKKGADLDIAISPFAWTSAYGIIDGKVAFRRP
jgi:hypothetical protein